MCVLEKFLWKKFASIFSIKKTLKPAVAVWQSHIKSKGALLSGLKIILNIYFKYLYFFYNFLIKIHLIFKIIIMYVYLSFFYFVTAKSWEKIKLSNFLSITTLKHFFSQLYYLLFSYHACNSLYNLDWSGSRWRSI